MGLENLPKKSVQFGRNLDLPGILIWRDTSVFKTLIGWPVCDRVCLLWPFGEGGHLRVDCFGNLGMVLCACGYWNFLARLKEFFERLIL